MSNRAAVSFLSSISLGGSQSQKKDPASTSSSSLLSQPASSTHPAQHHSHRDHFKAKLSSTLEKKHLIHRHANNNTNNNDKQQIAPTPAPTSQKPAIHPNSLKRSTSNQAINSENTSSSNLVIRSTSGTAIPNRSTSSSSSSSTFVDIREPSPRDKSPRDELAKSRNNVEQGSLKRDESHDYGIVRKASDTSVPPTGKARSGSTVDYNYKYSEGSKGRSDSMDGGKEGRRKSTNSETNAKTLLALDEKRQESLVSFANKEYRKLSKSTNDAASRNQLSSSNLSNAPSPHKSVISSSSVLPQKHTSRNKRDEKEKRPELTKSPSSKTAARDKKEASSPLKLSKTNLHNDLDIEEGPLKIKRQRRKKSKKKRSKGDSKRNKTPAKHNPAALDFLKGISLGENTPTLRHRKSYIGKSKLSEAYPQKSVPDAPNVNDNILFAGSASTKKIKIGEYASQAPGKIYLSTRTSSTFGVFSLIKYDSKANKKDKEKNALKESMAVSTIGKTKSISSGPLLPFGKNDFQETEIDQEYDPYFLDDPSLTTGKHRTVMNLACFKESIIPYVKPGVIKDELNELFRQKHPWVPHGVTLHKIRKLKKELVHIAVAGGLEVSTIAIAYVLFERLIIKGLITKPCIRLYGCVCLALAAKANDPHGDELKSTIEAMEKQLDVEKEDLLKSEFAAFHALSYSVHPSPEHVVPHIRLIIKDNPDLQPY